MIQSANVRLIKKDERAFADNKLTIGPCTLKGWRWGGYVAKLRFYASHTFTSDGVLYLSGSGQGYYIEVGAQVVSDVVYVPSFELPTVSDDSDTLPRYTGILCDEANNHRVMLCSNWVLPPVNGDGITWTFWESINSPALKNSSKKTTLQQSGCVTLLPEFAEAIRAVIREEMKRDRQHRRRALLAEVDSINRELDIK